MFKRVYKTVALALYKFELSDCKTRAAALTLYSMFAIVPTVAIALAIAKAFGFEDDLEGAVHSQMQGQSVSAKYLLQFARNMLYESQNSTITGIGIVLVFASAYAMLARLDSNINVIWNTYNRRAIPSKIASFLVFAVIAPIVVVSTSAMNIYIIGYLKQFIASYQEIKWLVSLELASNMISIGILSLLFAWLFAYFPVTKVNLKSSLVAGAVTGVLFQLLQQATIHFQVYMISYSAVFGSFAALPILIVWLQTAWMIFLFGACLTYILHYVPDSPTDINPDRLSSKEKITIAEKIIKFIIKKSSENAKMPTLMQVSEGIKCSKAMSQVILNMLIKANIVGEIHYYKDDNIRFILAIPLKEVSQETLHTMLMESQDL